MRNFYNFTSYVQAFYSIVKVQSALNVACLSLSTFDNAACDLQGTLAIGLFLIVYDNFTPKINTCQHIFIWNFAQKLRCVFVHFDEWIRMDEFVGMNGIISFIYVNINFTYDYYFTVQKRYICIVSLLCLCYLWDKCIVSFCFRVALTFNTSKL